LANIVPNIQAFAETFCSADLVFQIIERTSKINAMDDASEIASTFTGDIEFRSVHFKYPARDTAPVRITFQSFSVLFKKFLIFEKQKMY
jgi:ABC-type multidrug transport system fused ATPase/permease subunit